MAKIGLAPGKPQFHAATAAAQYVLPQLIVMTPVLSSETAVLEDEADEPASPRGSFFKHLFELMHRYSLGVFAILLLLIGIAAIQVGGAYWSTHVTDRIAKATPVAKLPARQIVGFNITVPASELQGKLQAVTSQPVTLTVGDHSTPVSGDIIKGWLQITANKNKTEYYIHTSQAAIGSSLAKLAKDYEKAPLNQVTVNEDGANVVVVGGRNGTALSDPNSLNTQAQQTAKNVLDSKGMLFSTPLADVPFQAVTPAAFDKVLVANVTTKKMWAYQNGQQVNSFLISAGKPSTPTPLGEFHVYAKFTVQDMRGTNPDGTPYFQPSVPWVNYFSAGSAVHGVYWHPLDWFGAINSSHGCVGLPVDEAQWVFNWAPIGTTVIVHA
jgi:lipoprotein-anchoring transpeptidase ErfK/SrfK